MPNKPGAAEESNRRSELIRSAGRLFHEQGYDATTIRDIAAAVGMRSGSPFYHFKSKQEILKAVVLEGLNSALAGMAAVTGAGLDPRETFQGLVRAHLRTILEHGGDFMPVLLYEWRSLSDESRTEIVALKNRYEAVWQKTLKDLKKAGLIRTDTKLSRLLIFGALNWTAQWYRPDGALSIDDIADQAADLFLCPSPSPTARRRAR
ncbi:MAG TPA: TetR/AcrR family transcriptional regulator [Rhodocyclaceae bacterium]|nr:TetR/AcrR family transcriptional regulator [Rhodocyclaceae bacterium]